MKTKRREDITTMQVKVETRARLDNLGDTHKESYDDIINTSREVHEMFKTTAIDTLKQDKKCQPCWYIILSTMSGGTTSNSAAESQSSPVIS